MWNDPKLMADALRRSLIRFTESAPDTPVFRFSDWLRALSLSEVEALASLLEQFASVDGQDSDVTGNLGAMLLIADAAERNLSGPDVRPKVLIRCVRLAIVATNCAILERRQLVYVEGRLGLQNNSVPILQSRRGRDRPNDNGLGLSDFEHPPQKRPRPKPGRFTRLTAAIVRAAILASCLLRAR